MSENIPSVSGTNKKCKRKTEKYRLPTPPPDPSTGNKTDEGDEVLAYLDSLQKSTNPNLSRSTSTFAPIIVTEEAFDHLEKLYKLMEQMLELREQNAKLHRKVRDLEHLNNLEKMHKQLVEQQLDQENCSELDKDTAFAETILESILSETRIPKCKSFTPNRLRQSILRRQRNRSGSAIDKGMGLEANQLDIRRASLSMDDRLDKPGKVSKWTKVKAAFKWEKASTTVGDAKSQDSGIGGMIPVNLEVARYLRVPSTSEDTGHSPADSCAAEISTPGTLSTASSTEDFHRNELRTPCEDAKSSDDEHSHNYIPRSKDGSQKSNKSFKTPWAKMKDIIHTRSSFKKKQRLSSHSDDIQIDIELCSDNEDVFEEDVKNRSPQIYSSSPIPYSNIYKRVDSCEIPPDIIARYKQAINDDGNVSDAKKISKWTRVKKAFLTPNDAKQMSTSSKDNIVKLNEEVNSAQAEIQKNYKQLQKKLSLEFQEKLSEWERMKQNSPCTSNPSSACGFVDDNPDPAFMKKMEEWQKIKSQSANKNSNIQMKSEEQLPPEFRRKLEEWKKIKKTPGKDITIKKKLGDVPKWKSLGTPKCDSSPVIEYPVLSDDFRKKLEEWKQIKAAGTASVEEPDTKSTKDSKLPSPRLSRKNLSPKHSKKQKDQQEKELQWFEKELGKIEKEKQRLEKERQKFLEREERLSKLRSAIIGGNKKEVLIHTPSGFHRFEGISRKFTQKLYEWEKAQGIGPESSTFALLKSSYVPEMTPHSRQSTAANTPPLIRSKSADSIVISALNLTCPLMTHQLSSLSLNDVDELEKECMRDSKSSSLQFIAESQEFLNEDEPEALIVEIEDVVEETAAPLHTFAQNKQQPVYQTEGIKAICEGERCATPKIRRSESAKAQDNYNLIEEILNILKNLNDNELEIQKIQNEKKLNENRISENANLFKLNDYNDSQKYFSNILVDKIFRLQEANANVVSNITKENSGVCEGHTSDILEAVQDLSSEIIQLADKLQSQIDYRNIINSSTSKEDLNFSNSLMAALKEIRHKLLDLRRRLSYICAASDLTAPGRRRLNSKKKAKKSVSNESKSDTNGTQSGNEKSPSSEGRLYIKAETSNTQSQGAIKKRIKYRQKNLQNRSLPDSDDEDDENREQRRNKHKKLTRTRSISEGNLIKFENVHKEKALNLRDNVVSNDEIARKILIPIQCSIVSPTENEETAGKPLDSPVTVFIKTTRKLFTPFVESNLSESKESESRPVKTEILETNKASPKIVIEKTETIITKDFKSNDEINKMERTNSNVSIAHLPPLPISPIPQRKMLKEISPSIRVMLAKYNQKISEQDLHSNKSGGSSGSASPVAWRSPTAERRVKAQTEKYQEELNKLSPLLGERKEVQKSASVGVLHTNNRQVTVLRKNLIKNNDNSGNLSKSSSVTDIISKNNKGENKMLPSAEKRTDLKLNLDLQINPNIPYTKHSPEIRLKKLQKAKEEFLKSSPSSGTQSPADETIKFPGRNRLSQISMDSESSYDSAIAGALIKSASAGMINVDADVYRQFDPEIHGGGYVSLPRSTSKQKHSLLNGKFAFSNIAAKFRKVKMRRHKDANKKGGAVSTLCRQSLVVDINPEQELARRSNEIEERKATTPSDEVSTSSNKSGIWTKRPKLFKR